MESLIISDTKQIDRLVLELKGFEKEASEVLYNALNRTVEFTVNEAARQVVQKYAIKRADVKAALTPKRPSRFDLSAGVRVKGHTLSFAHFPHTPSKPRKGKYKVKVTVFKGQKRDLNTNPKAFVAPTGANSPEKVQSNIFIRTGVKRVATKGRYAGQMREAITLPRTLSVPQMVGNAVVTEKIQEKAAEKLQQRVEHEITRSFSKMGAGR